jgi:osmoprotectant transport system permease protein
VSRNAVLLCLVLAGAAAMLFTGFVSTAPNRLVSGAPLALWQAVPAPLSLAIASLAAALLAAAFLPQRRGLQVAVMLAAALLLLLICAGAGVAASRLAVGAPRAARTGLGPAFWIACIIAALVILDALQRLRAGPGLRLAVTAGLGCAFLLMADAGWFDALSILREYAGRRGAFLAELARHCVLVLGALAPALVIGVPLGLMAARRPKSQGPLFATLNFIQTVPSIALFGLLIAPLVAIGLPGVGVVPAIIALALYALLPVVRNTHAGLVGVDPAVIESATGMGMRARQIFWRVELPLGLPVFLAGLRIVLVQTIGLACVAALIGAGGLGSFVFQGIGQYAIDLVLLGAVPTILLALTADFALSLLITLARPERAP